MKFFKWKIFFITSIVCLFPIVLGVLLWQRLPQTMAIHFDIYGRPDNFASKEFVVFGLPFLMVVFQAFCCFVTDINSFKRGKAEKFERVTKWIIPVFTNFLQVITLGFGLGWDIDIRRAVVLMLTALFLVLGNYIPKLDYIKHFDLDAEKAGKINRFIGYETTVMGILFLISVFLPPLYSVICIFLLIPYAITALLYGIIEGRK